MCAVAAVRVCYQWEPILEQPLDEFIRMLRAVALTPDEHASRCGGASTADGGGVFKWGG